VSSVFAPPAINLSLFLNAFDKFLRTKYGFTGNGTKPTEVNPVYCNSGWAGGLERLIKTRNDGARAGGRKVADTGWKPDELPVDVGRQPGHVEWTPPVAIRYI
jgi:hypothetical protein